MGPLLLLSNSTSDAGYLTHARGWIADVLGSARRIAFVPYAAVTFAYDEYAARVADALAGLAVTVQSVHTASDPAEAIHRADAVFVGGGNTFHLLREASTLGVLDAIRQRVAAGAPYVGWSAGANLAGPTIRTTNDMPIVEPPTFEALGLVPIQINPHYTDAHPPGHRGETRAERLAEFVAANPTMPVVGLPEGTGVHVARGTATLLGDRLAWIFDATSPAGREASVGEAEALFVAPPRPQ